MRVFQKVEGAKNYSELPNRRIIQNPFTEKPLVSYGIVAYAEDSKRWLVVKRKYTPEFLNLIRGSYRKASLSVMIDRLSLSEKEILIGLLKSSIEFDTIFTDVFPERTEEMEYAKSRFDENHLILESILNLSKSPGLDDFIWPKGRPNPGEDGFLCARREFREETGVKLTNQCLVSPYEIVDVCQGVDGRIYETRYWVYLFSKEIKLYEPYNSNREIGSRIWISEAEASKVLSPSRFAILGKAKLAIETYR